MLRREEDEVLVSYFVLCDQVITEQGTGKQSLIGVYSALMTEQLPMQANIAAAFGLRVQTARSRELTFRFTGPEGETIFASPVLPYNWESVQGGIEASGFATLQIGINLRAMPFNRVGVYTASLSCDGALLATYPISVLPTRPGGPG